MIEEAKIVINGIHLDPGFVMTIRVALEIFWEQLLSEEIEKGSIDELYLDRIRDLRRIMSHR